MFFQEAFELLCVWLSKGGKTSHIASLMRNQGILIALDKAKKKIDRIKENLKRTGCTIAQVYAYDSISAVKEASIESCMYYIAW